MSKFRVKRKKLVIALKNHSFHLVMFAQALSGIAKDLNKMSAKTSTKNLVKGNRQGKLYKRVAILTGSKNALKGAGFFVGGLY